jgi:hypothetical protein
MFNQPMNFKLDASPLEICLFVIFIVYIIFPIPTPRFLAPFIDNPLGIVIILLASLYLFLYTHPVLGVLAFFTAYELIRRSSIARKQIPLFDRSTNQRTTDAYMKAMNPVQEISLEENIVSSMTSNQFVNKTMDYIMSSYRPVQENTYGATTI